MRYKELHMDRTKIPCQKLPIETSSGVGRKKKPYINKLQDTDAFYDPMGHGETQNEEKKTYQELQSSNARRAGKET